MVGPLLLWVAAALPLSSAATPAPNSSAFHPTVTASAHATARIMVISGAKFGQGYSAVPSGAYRRSARLTDYDGQVKSAELLEFQ
jgi:hypothetical protein